MTQNDQREQALLQWINQNTEFNCHSLQVVSGDASFRRYFRFTNQHQFPGKTSNQSIIAVDAPPKFESSQRFSEIAVVYRAAGLPVPEIYTLNIEAGFYCLEDFGNAQFAEALNSRTMQTLYASALSFVPKIQKCTEINSKSLPLFDDTLLNRELALFTHWLIEVHLGLSLSSKEVTLIENTYQFISEVFKNQPQVGVHRDYHCRNLMILHNKTVGIIDFQDAVIGPITYDAVSLLRDCYQHWNEAQILPILVDFHATYYSQYPWSEFKTWFDLTGLQRHIKASGIFARLCHRDAKKGFLQDIPRALDYIVEIGSQYAQCKEFADLVELKIKPLVARSLP